MPHFENLHIVLRFAIIVAVGVWTMYCAFADDNTLLKRVGFTAGIAMYGLLCIEEGRVRERAKIERRRRERGEECPP